MKLPGGIKTKLTLWYLMMVGILVSGFGLIAYLLLADGLSSNIAEPWNMRQADITILPDGTGQVTQLTDINDTSSAGIYNIQSLSGTRVLELASEDGVIELSSLEGTPIVISNDILTENGTISGDELVIYIYSSKLDPSDLKLIVTTRQQDNITYVLGIFKRTTIIAASIILLIAGTIGFIIIWWRIRPLNTIIDSINRSPGEKYKQRFTIDSTDEVGELAKALNRLFDQTEDHIRKEKQITSDISHELRTPLAIAQAEASLALTKNRNSEEYRKALENVSREIFHLSSLVDKLLFLARPEKNNGLDMKIIDLHEFLQDISFSAEVICELKDQVFSYRNADDNHECFIRGDITRLKELFLNLIDNAVSYTPHGGSIHMSLEQRRNFISVNITDTGIGISEEYIPKIFNRFYRIQDPCEYDKAGSGLGLAICKRIAVLHKGAISVTSTPGQGSTFTVTLPIINDELSE